MSKKISDFAIETGKIEKGPWHEIISRFDDVNIYQTWAFDAKRRGISQVDHFILRDKKGIISAAQVRVIGVPALHAGVAYVRWGPLWNVGGDQRDPEIFRQAVRALRDEYVLRRGLLLRIFPVLFEDQDLDLGRVLAEEGFSPVRQPRRERTLLLDVRLPLQELRKNLDQKWRNCLNRAEKNELEIIEGESSDLFGDFVRLYDELLIRKGFKAPNDIRSFSCVQTELPEGWKMRVFLCRARGSLVAGAICSALGHKGLYLFGASNEQGRSLKGSYLIQWKIIQWLKESGAMWYDLNGISPDINPGTYRFKAGIAGKSGRDVLFLGQFESYPRFSGRPLSVMINGLLPLAHRIRPKSEKNGRSMTG